MLLHLVTPGDLAKDSFFSGLGFSPALLGHVEAGVVFGILTLLVNVVFRVVELRLKYGRKGKSQNDAHSP